MVAMARRPERLRHSFGIGLSWCLRSFVLYKIGWSISLLSCPGSHKDSSTKMETIVSVGHVLIYSLIRCALCVAGTCVLVVVILSNSSRQRLLPNVPIVGLDRTKTIKQAREQFRHGSKTMLLEGYRKVFPHVPMFDLDYIILVQRKTVLHSDHHGRATHDSCQLCGGAQECACLASRFSCYIH